MVSFKFPSQSFLANVICTDLNNGVLRLALENVSMLEILLTLNICKLGQSKVSLCWQKLTNFGRTLSTRHSILGKIIDIFSSLSLDIASSILSQPHNLSNLSFPRFWAEESDNKLLRLSQWTIKSDTKFWKNGTWGSLFQTPVKPLKLLNANTLSWGSISWILRSGFSSLRLNTSVNNSHLSEVNFFQVVESFDHARRDDTQQFVLLLKVMFSSSQNDSEGQLQCQSFLASWFITYSTFNLSNDNCKEQIVIFNYWNKGEYKTKYELQCITEVRKVDCVAQYGGMPHVLHIHI